MVCLDACCSPALDQHQQCASHLSMLPVLRALVPECKPSHVPECCSVEGTPVLKSFSLVTYPPLTWKLTAITPVEAVPASTATAAANAAATATGGRKLKQVRLGMSVACAGSALGVWERSHMPKKRRVRRRLGMAESLQAMHFNLSCIK
jgi:hypothetical protein